jgi:hypothetical protein
MKDMWKFFVMPAIGYLRAAGEAKRAEDPNDTGKDDAIGASLIYAADLLTALLTGKDLPKAPAALR